MPDNRKAKPASNKAAPKTIPTVALAGNPNCGKTTIFNALTGLNYKVANYPGVTVEKKTGRVMLDDKRAITLVDLPGIYNLSGTSLDEIIAARSLLGDISAEDRPDLIVSVVDAGNLERNLYLTTQLVDLGIPIVLVLNMIDVAEKEGISIKCELLARALDVPVVVVAASKGRGLGELKHAIAKGLNDLKPSNKAYAWIERDSKFLAIAESLGRVELSETTENSSGAAPLPPIFVGTGLLSESRAPSTGAAKTALAEGRQTLLEAGIDSFSYEATHRYRYIDQVVRSSCVQTSTERRRLYDRIDAIITHRIWGTLIFVVTMAFIFQSIFLWASYPMDFIDGIFVRLGNWLTALLPAGELRSLLVDGVVAGVGAVVIFVPQIAILFFFLGILEESGYLSRAAFLMDRIMRKFGLQGRSFIPLLSSFACAIPGILSTRTIPSFADRMTTIMIAPLMSCSARLPVYTLLIAAFIPDTRLLGVFSLQGLVLLSMYLLGILGAAIVAWLLKLTALRGQPALFVMEMPRFRAPALILVLRDTWDRVTIFLKSAGTMILACSIVLWFLAAHPSGDIHDSYAGRIGHFIEPVIAPLGYNWEIGIGLLASFAAREVFISTLSTVYNLESATDLSRSLITVLNEKEAAGIFSLPTALSLMVFYVFACQCMSTLAVCRRETGSWGWTIFMFSYMTLLAYVAAFVTYRLALYFL